MFVYDLSHCLQRTWQTSLHDVCAISLTLFFELHELLYLLELLRDGSNGDAPSLVDKIFHQEAWNFFSFFTGCL